MRYRYSTSDVKQWCRINKGKLRFLYNDEMNRNTYINRAEYSNGVLSVFLKIKTDMYTDLVTTQHKHKRAIYELFNTGKYIYLIDSKTSSRDKTVWYALIQFYIKVDEFPDASTMLDLYSELTDISYCDSRGINIEYERKTAQEKYERSICYIEKRLQNKLTNEG